MAAALAALMDRSAAGEVLTLRALMLQRVAQSTLDDTRKHLLLNLIETYFVLAGDEEESFRRLLERLEYREVQEMQVTWADRMIERGREEGLHAGELKGKRDTLLRLLTLKFGPLPEEVMTGVKALNSLIELDSHLDRLLTASTLAEVGLGS